MPHLLIVDDNPTNLKLLRMTLRSGGHTMVEAEDGVQAMKVLDREKVDAVISDILMPNMDGYRFCHEVRSSAKFKATPIILYSSTYLSPGDHELALSFGANAFLEKPASIERLNEVINTVLGVAPPVPATEPARELGVLKQYSERLVRKVEEKNLELARRTTELEASEEKLRQVTDHIREVFWVSDRATGQIYYISPAYEEIWGRKCEDLYRDASNWFDAIHPDDRAAIQASPAITGGDGTAFTIEYRIVRPDKTIRWIRARGFPVKTSSGDVRRIAGVADDITEEKKLAAQLAQAQKMEAVGRLAGGVAHDFNNLLTVILGYCDVMQMRIDPRDPLLPLLDQVRGAGQRAASLTRQLLAFSRKQVLQPTVFNVNESVVNMEKMLRRLIGEHIELAVGLEPSPAKVRADAGQVEQVIMNLAVNARDAMPEGGRLLLETRNVTVSPDQVDAGSAVAAGPYVLLAVSDTGTGMTDEVKAHLFEPFFTTKEQGKGTGLGLSTAHGIVKQSGGHVQVYSELGRGTTFKVYLPRVDADVERPSETWQAPASLRGKETILVVEDEAMVRTLVVSSLKLHGYVVHEAANGGEGLLICEKHTGPIDLVITDVVMPQMSGPEFVDRLRLLRGGIRVLFSSGYTDIGVFHQGGLSRGAPFIQKPYALDVLLRKVREVLDSPPFTLEAKNGKAT